MSIPILNYSPSSQNQRVSSWEINGDEQPRIYTTDNCPSQIEINELIKAAYRLIFNEQQLLNSSRQKFLESQLINQQITVRQFVKGLLLSDPFNRLNYQVNNNYRFVEICFQRVLGRRTYNEKEKLAWSIILATKGLEEFVNQLLNTQEYLDNFGDDILPYQRRRILPQRESGELPFARTPRYAEDYRTKLENLGNFAAQSNKQYPWMLASYRWSWQRPPYTKFYAFIAQATLVSFAVLFILGVIAVALGAWGIISL